MSMPVLLLGAVMALPVFLALVFSLSRLGSAAGWLRRAHGAALALTLAMMAAVTYEAPLPAALAGAGLAAAAALAFWLEARWNKVLPLFQAAAGLAVAAGMPFQ
ncbi:MAG: hypothetical protein AAF192_10925 [Pseudomonadota bacterium]